MTINISTLGFDEAVTLADQIGVSLEDEAGSPEDARGLVRADVVVGLSSAFQEVESDPFTIIDSLAVMEGENDQRHRIFTVPWKIVAIQSGPLGNLNSPDSTLPLTTLTATDAPVLIEGLTTVQFDTGASVVHLRRYVDWNLVLAQIGVSVAFRGAPQGGSFLRDFQGPELPLS